MYEKTYLLLKALSDYDIYGYPACHIIGLLIPVPFLLISRLTSSVVIKLSSIPIGLLFYFLPDVVNLFADFMK